jgi:osmotically inducible lipoprotein OsmB
MFHAVNDNVKNMIKGSIPSLTAIVLCLGLSACATGPTTQDVGTATGAVIGGVAGAVLTGGNTAATIGGAALGGLAGNRISKSVK